MTIEDKKIRAYRLPVVFWETGNFKWLASCPPLSLVVSGKDMKEALFNIQEDIFKYWKDNPDFHFGFLNFEEPEMYYREVDLVVEEEE